jgi:hypothetical protein
VNETRYPLCWPQNWKRTATRVRAQFGKAGQSVGQFQRLNKSRLSIEDSFRRIEYEMERFGVELHTVLVSTNIRPNMRGLPAGNSGEPSDPGVAVYWTLKGKAQCMAIDRYDRVADNLAAVAATLEALRAIERHGGGSILERAFLGFAQLPAATGRPWRDVFGFGLSTPTATMVEEAYRRVARERHPDKPGGDHEDMVELNAARVAALAELAR